MGQTLSRVIFAGLNKSLLFLNNLYSNVYGIRIPKLSLVKVNLGCGLAVAPNWINIDGSPIAFFASAPSWLSRMSYRLSGSRRHYSLADYQKLLRTGEFRFHNLARGCPIAENTVDYFYSSHFLEHLNQKEALNLLQDCYRALKPGGYLRVSIPDLEIAISLYATDKRRMLNNFFYVNDGDNEFSRHRYLYDFEMLKEILSAIGYTHIKKQSIGKGQCPDLETLDNRGEDSLFVECRKPEPAKEALS